MHRVLESVGIPTRELNSILTFALDRQEKEVQENFRHRIAALLVDFPENVPVSTLVDYMADWLNDEDLHPRTHAMCVQEIITICETRVLKALEENTDILQATSDLYCSSEKITATQKRCNALLRSYLVTPYLIDKQSAYPELGALVLEALCSCPIGVVYEEDLDVFRDEDKFNLFADLPYAAQSIWQDENTLHEDQLIAKAPVFFDTFFTGKILFQDYLEMHSNDMFKDIPDFYVHHEHAIVPSIVHVTVHRIRTMDPSLYTVLLKQTESRHLSPNDQHCEVADYVRDVLRCTLDAINFGQYL
jgi:hypothetical protein